MYKEITALADRIEATDAYTAADLERHNKVETYRIDQPHIISPIDQKFFLVGEESRETIVKALRLYAWVNDNTRFERESNV